MKIWILEIGEPLPLESGVRLHRHGLFSQWLAKQGHEVTWWTSSFSHAPKKNFADRDQDLVVDGVTLRIIHSVGYKKNVSLDRIKHNKNFAKAFAEKAPSCPTPDLVIAPIPIIEAAYEAIKYGEKNRVPVLLDIRDLWPDELADLAPSPLRPLAKLFLQRSYHKMKYVCQKAAGIMGVSQSYLQYGLNFARRNVLEKDLFFPFGYSPEPVSQEEMRKARLWRDQFGFSSDAFRICFFGTIGRFFDLKTVIASVRELQKDFPVELIVAGHGSSLEDVKSYAAGAKGIYFPGWLNASQIAAIMEISHAGIAPYAKGTKMALPNKPFEYMAGGLPILSSIQGELAQILATHQCGLTYEADSQKQLSDCIKMLKHSQALREKMAKNSTLLFANHFTTEKIFTRVNAHFLRFFAGNQGTTVLSARPQDLPQG